MINEMGEQTSSGHVGQWRGGWKFDDPQKDAQSGEIGNLAQVYSRSSFAQQIKRRASPINDINLLGGWNVAPPFPRPRPTLQHRLWRKETDLERVVLE